MLYDKLKSKKSFSNLRNQGSSYVTPAFVLLAYKTENDKKLKVGFTSSKKVGNAILRARSRRRLKAALREINPEFLESFNGFEFNIIARYKVLTLDFNKIVFYFEKTLNNVKKDYAKKD